MALLRYCNHSGDSWVNGGGGGRKGGVMIIHIYNQHFIINEFLTQIYIVEIRNRTETNAFIEKLNISPIIVLKYILGDSDFGFKFMVRHQ